MLLSRAFEIGVPLLEEILHTLALVGAREPELEGLALEHEAGVQTRVLPGEDCFLNLHHRERRQACEITRHLERGIHDCSIGHHLAHEPDWYASVAEIG